MKKLYEEGFTQNRELSWLRFNERCLDEAADRTVPTLERLQFINIFNSNLDEFFMVRVGSLLDMRFVSDDERDPISGMTPSEQLRAIYEMVPELYHKRDRLYRDVTDALAEDGIEYVPVDRLRFDEQDHIYQMFVDEIRYRLHPVIISERDRFPALKNKATYHVATLPTERGMKIALVEIPWGLDSVIVLSKSEKRIRYTLTEDVIFRYLGELLLPFDMSGKTRIRITRNAEIKSMDESQDMPENFRIQMQKLVRDRANQEADRLEIQGDIDRALLRYLLDRLELSGDQCFRMDAIPDISYLKDLKKHVPPVIRARVSYDEFQPLQMENPYDEKVLDMVKERDIFSCYPYDSMNPLLTMLREASIDPRVREIRMTIYRLADHAKIADYLAKAAENGKKVKVLIELRARFDEQNNIEWSEKLEKAGCKVYYGSEGLEDYKVHCKVCQIVLEEMGEKRYITQVGTGNYNESTATLYTDISIITYNQKLGKDVSKFFKNISKSRYDQHYKCILAAPADFKPEILRLIERETRKKENGRIFIKVNSITDTDVIERLAAASNAGVKVRMVVRGICCILPGVEFYTENIDVVNVVGRYLEHSRVYVFGSKKFKDETMYIASADLMTRNTENRVELAFPVTSKKIRRKIKKILLLNYMDNVKGRRLDAQGIYRKKPSGGEVVDSQRILMEKTRQKQGRF